ncbi:hypothetical protein BH11BAC2_BH11BAC2_26000 [soil metagenome]
MKRITNKLILTFCFVLISFHDMMAQIAPVQADSTVFVKPMFPELLSNASFYLISGFFLILLIIVVVLARTVTQMAKTITGYEEPVVEVIPAAVESISLWKRFDRKFFTKAVPIEKEKDIMFDHSYDGIYELDNDLPPWWKYGFYLTILFAFVYLISYHVLKTGKLQLAEYKQELADADAQQKARMAKMVNFITEENVLALKDEAGIAAGKETFTKNCVACHGSNGEGLVGPNFTDQYWIHGGGIKNIFKTITNGVPAKGMISWKSQLSPKQIQEVGSYILTFQGSKPANGKEPQGTLWIDPQLQTDSTLIVKSDSSNISAAVESSIK